MASIEKKNFSQEDWVLVYNSSKFWYFPDFSWDPETAKPKKVSKSLHHVYYFTYGERKIWWNIKKPQIFMKIIVVRLSQSRISNPVYSILSQSKQRKKFWNSHVLLWNELTIISCNLGSFGNRDNVK